MSQILSRKRFVVQIRRSAIVGYSAIQMFDLVNDIEAYPRRFPWCAGAAVLARGEAELTARLDLRLAGMTQSLTTRNQLDPPHRIGVNLIEGPFRQLTGTWGFLALGDRGCKIALALDFDYAGGLLGPLMRTGFEILADRLVDDFCREAQREYG